jgi:quinol monooxygenase YgiN
MSKFVLAVGLVIKPDQVDRFMSMLLENGKAARETEPGCRQFDVLVDPKDRTRVMLYEVYEDEAAFQAHQQTPHFKRYIADAIPLVQSRDRFFFRRVAP